MEKRNSAAKDSRIEGINLALEKVVLLLAGSFALALPFLFPPAAPLHFVALVPWIVLFLHRRYAARSAWMLLGGFVFLAAALHPFGAIHVSVPPLLALLNCVPLIVFPIALKRLARLPLPLAISAGAAWVTTEWLRVWLSARQLQMYFLGASQFRWTLLIQIADFGGIYAVSFVVAAVNGATADLVLRSRRRASSVVAALAIIAVTLLYGAFRMKTRVPADGPSVAVVQPVLPHTNTQQSSDRFAGLESFTRRSIWPMQADVVVWPENAIPEDLTGQRDHQLALSRLARYLHSYLVVGARDFAYVLSPDGIPLDRYQKTQLLFWSDSSALQLLLLPRLGDDEPRPVIFDLKPRRGAFRFATPIGMEIVNPALWRVAAGEGAEFFINVTSEGRLSRSVYVHLLALSAFRAVENRVGVVRAANDGLSAFISPQGRVQAIAPDGQKKVLIERVRIDPQHGRTFYARFGDVFVLVCAFMVVIGFAVSLFRSRLSIPRAVPVRTIPEEL